MVQAGTGSGHRFKNRTEAGQVLAGLLRPRVAALGDSEPPLVLALPRGGVPVAAEVARHLGAPLDIWVVRKLGLPGHEEYAVGAIASGGVRTMNELPGPALSAQALEPVLAREHAELARREQLYRGQRPPAAVRGRHVILVDDGLATGASMRAAALAVRAQQPARLTVAVPVGPRETCQALREVADDVVCAAMPQPFGAVSRWYEHMPQCSDDEVRQLLAQEEAGLSGQWPGTAQPGH